MMEITNITSPLRFVALFIVLLLLQVLVCNNILLFGVAVPFVYIYFIITLPMNVSLPLLMSLAFSMGFLIDLFGDTLGLNCMASLILSVLKKPIFYAYMHREEKFLAAIPSISSMGWPNYLKFILSLSTIFCLIIFGIELFSFASFGRIILMAASSSLFTIVTLIAADSLFNREPDRS